MSQERSGSFEPVLETERLVLSRLSAPDAPFIFELVNDAAWIRYIGDRGVHMLQDAEGYIAKGPVAMYAAQGFGLYRVSRREDAASIGICGLLKRDFLEHVDLGFALLERFRGRGYALEAASGVVEYARETLRLPRLDAITVPENGGSMKVLGKLGFRFEKMIEYPGETAPLRLLTLELRNPQVVSGTSSR